MAHLITGHAGTEHIMPSDDGAFNAGVLGTGKYVLDIGNKFGYEIVSNNLVKILDGELVNQGRHMNIPVNNYEEVTIENGLQSVKRYDLICMRYTKNADTSIESAELVVVKGTSSTSPSDPTCEEGNILEGALVDDFPLYRVRLDGLNIEGVDCLFETIPSIEALNLGIEALNLDVESIKDDLKNTNKPDIDESVEIIGFDTTTKTTMKITLAAISSFALLIGRNGTGLPIIAMIANNAVINLSSQGTYTMSNGQVCTCDINNWCLGYLIARKGCIVDITYE